MAGSGEFTRVGNTRSLNAQLGAAITGGVICPGADQIGNLSAGISAGATAQTTLSCAASGGGAVLTKAIPDDAVIVVCSSTGGVDTMESFTVNGSAASGAASITIDSCTVNKARSAGDPIFLLAFKPYLTAMTNQTTPADHTLGTEYSVTGMARQLVPWTAPTAADPPVAANQSTVTFGPLTGADGSKVIAYLTLMDAPSGGTIDNAYAWWTLASTRTPNAGDSLQVAAAALTLNVFH